jgi:hypothetical protein
MKGIGLSSDSERSHSGFAEILQQASGNSRGNNVFDDILEDLNKAYDSQRGAIGKTFVGAGLILTHLFKAGFSWLFGSVDPKQEMRDRLAEQQRQLSGEKKEQLRGDWKALRDFARQEIVRNAEGKIGRLDRQLLTLQANAGLEEAAIERKLDVIARQEQRLRSVETSLKNLIQSIATDQRKVKV